MNSLRDRARHAPR